MMPDKNGFTFFFFSFLCFMPGALHAQRAVPDGRPNIIFILADDLGYEALRINGGSYNTPHLDKMAKYGMRFTNCSATPLCTPSRVELMTGKYNFRNYKGFGILDSSQVTFGHLLKQAGYITGITGKWQLFGTPHQQKLAGQKGTYPQDAGFDDYFVWQVTKVASRYKSPVIYSREGNKSFPEEYGPELFAGYAKRFIELNRDTSFFLYYPMVLTHDPFQPTPANNTFAGAGTESKSDTAYFRYMVEFMDEKVGEIIEKVREEGLLHKTLIVFAGDNGTSTKIVSVLNGTEIRGGKRSSTVYGTHVPLIAYWDGVIKPEQVNDNLIDFTDFLPTFLETAGKNVPLTFHADGISFYGQLLNKHKAQKRKWTFCWYNPGWGAFEPRTWIQNKKWKLYQTGEFYNLQKDPEEKHPVLSEDLKGIKLKVKQNLNREMLKLLRERGTKLYDKPVSFVDNQRLIKPGTQKGYHYSSAR